MSTIAVFAYSAALAVSPPNPCSSEALNEVTFFMYSFALTPAVLYASSAYFLIIAELSAKRVSTPPICCSKSAPISNAFFIVAPMASVETSFTAVLFSDCIILFPLALPASLPAFTPSPFKKAEILEPVPSIDGIICIYALPSVAPSVILSTS